MKIFRARQTLIAMLMLAVVVVAPSTRAQAPRHIDIVAKRFEFAPQEITLKKGEPVVLSLKTEDVPHSLRFKELGVSIKADKGKAGETTLTPDRTGDFIGHCGIFCGAGHAEMTFTLHIVE